MRGNRHKCDIKIFSIAIDFSCEGVFENINTSEQIEHAASDMAEVEYPTLPDLDSNTCFTRNIRYLVEQGPPSVNKYLIQGNNFFESDKHIRCYNTAGAFLK